jgi:Asp-tRNA(Asn)/Glu-tRNA(Gln) amidotransferase A subunit family amidase
LAVSSAFELAASLDHIGPMTRSAADAGAMLAAIAGPDPLDPTAAQVAFRIRCGPLRQACWTRTRC